MDFPHNSVLRKLGSLSLRGLSGTSFHTILSYGNTLGSGTGSARSLSTFHTILSYGNVENALPETTHYYSFHTILSYGN